MPNPTSTPIDPPIAHADIRRFAEDKVNLLADIGSEATEVVDVEAATLTQLLGDVRLKARARGWTPSEKQLRA